MLSHSCVGENERGGEGVRSGRRTDEGMEGHRATRGRREGFVNGATGGVNNNRQTVQCSHLMGFTRSARAEKMLLSESPGKALCNAYPQLTSVRAEKRKSGATSTHRRRVVRCSGREGGVTMRRAKGCGRQMW